MRLLLPRKPARGGNQFLEGSHVLRRRVADKRVDQHSLSCGTKMLWWEGNRRPFKILRTITLLMIPFCWVVFYDGRLFPREGHSLWVAGMVLALFSDGPSSSREVPAASTS